MISTFIEVNSTSDEPVEIIEMRTKKIVAVRHFNSDYNGYQLENFLLLDVTFSNGIVLSNLSAHNYDRLVTQLGYIEGGSLDVSVDGTYSYENKNSSGKFKLSLWERFQIKGDNDMTYEGEYCYEGAYGQICDDYYNFGDENHTEIFVDIMQLKFIELINWSVPTNVSFSFTILGVIFI